MSQPITPARAAAPIRPVPAAVFGIAAALTLLVILGAPAGALAAAGYLGLALIALEFLLRGIAATRTGRILPTVVTALALAAAGGISLIASVGLSEAYGWATVFALTGGVLIYAGLSAASAATPWQGLSNGRALRQPAAAIVLTGVLALLPAAYLGLIGWAPLRAIYPTRALALALMVALGLAAAAMVVFVRALRPPRTTPTARHDAEVAAHLHDSVLQTLALIGRNADDPDRTRQLARQQERSLRAWLAGRDEASATSLAGAIRVAAQEVEDEVTGSRIEVVAVGDAPLDRWSDAMVRAAREAMRNAVRHAGSPVRVFVEVDGDAREVFVRDTGAGFDLAQIAEERRGIKDAIIGRMEHVGGTATIESGPSGTEIALRVDGPTAGSAGQPH